MQIQQNDLKPVFSNSIDVTVSKENPKLSIIIPCFNEERTILPVLNAISKLNLPNYEIIVVDDGSTDNSLKAIENYPKIRLFIHAKNEGYGKTLIDGIYKSTGDIILTIDSDGQHDPMDIITLIQPILDNDADIVIGSRYLGQYDYTIPLTTRGGEALIEVILKLLFGKGVKNNQGGFRAFNRKILKLLYQIHNYDMAFTTELLFLAYLNQYRVIEKPIHLHDRPSGKSRVKRFKLLRNVIESAIYYTIQKIKRLTFRRKNLVFNRPQIQSPVDHILDKCKNPIRIIIPVYNEEKAIEIVLRKTQKVLEPEYHFNITAIDDGSKDHSQSILLQSPIPAEVLINKQNRGKGYTISRGFSSCKPDEIVVFMDADGEHPPEEIPNLIAPIIRNEADVVIGSRFLRRKNIKNDKGSYLENQKEFSYLRKFGNFIFSILVFIFHHQFITDTQCGFRAYAPGIIKRFKNSSSGFQIETEMAIKCIQMGYRVKEIPINSGISSRKSHMKIISDSFKIGLLIIEMSLPKSLNWIAKLFFRPLYRV